MSATQTDFAVIGAGPAGLQAALTIGRVHRDAIMFDSSEYRNATVDQMHNVAGFDGMPPAEFRAQAREQLADYPSVRVVAQRVESIASIGTPEAVRFALTLTDGVVVEARAVVLATGVRDELPDIAGLQDIWGTLAAQCPFCHGHEFAGERIALLGAPAAPHLGAWLAPLASRLVVLADGAEVDGDTQRALDTFGAEVVAGRVESITREADGLVITVEGADGAGEEVDAAGIFVVPTLHQRAPFATQLGLELNPSGCVRVDAFGRTSVPGVYAAGDMAHLPEFPMPQASVIQSLAAGQTAAASAMRG